MLRICADAFLWLGARVAVVCRRPWFLNRSAPASLRGALSSASLGECLPSMGRGDPQTRERWSTLPVVGNPASPRR